MKLNEKTTILYLLLSLTLSFSILGCNSSEKTAESFPEESSTLSYMADASSESCTEPTSFTESTSESYNSFTENPFIKTTDESFSTFSIDVDTASYSNVRRFINLGELPPVDAVRTEEFINYFKYDYPQPTDGLPFTLSQEMMPCPWNESHQLLLVGLQGKELKPEEVPPSNLVFLLDVSGSMDEPNKLPLLKKSFNILTSNLKSSDCISIVVYAGASGIILDGAKGNDENLISEALSQLEAGGSTAGAEGIATAYELAEKHFIKNGNNRVILATDGDFNVGPNSEEDLIRIIEKKRNKDIFLSVLGLGMGNYKDDKMESLADHGNGNYAYIDTLQEAKKVLGEELNATLFTIAKDVKVQIDFNPDIVDAYRLIGYENRLLNKQDFDNDAIDAGEIGAGHSVTALYEIIPTPASNTYNTDFNVTSTATYYQDTAVPIGNEYGLIKLRYKTPDSSKSNLLTTRFSPTLALSRKNITFAASIAEYCMLIRESAYKGSSSLDHILNILEPYVEDDSYKAEFYDLVEATKPLLPLTLTATSSNTLSYSLTPTTENPNIINAYLTIINKLYQEDPGLNAKISILAIDTTQMCNITLYEKTLLLEKLRDLYELEVMDTTYETLQEQGYISKDDLNFPDGILIKIEDTPFQGDFIKEGSTFTFNASKWRSGLGAIGYNGASITYSSSNWEIATQGLWIS